MITLVIDKMDTLDCANTVLQSFGRSRKVSDLQRSL